MAQDKRKSEIHGHERHNGSYKSFVGSDTGLWAVTIRCWMDALSGPAAALLYLHPPASSLSLFLSLSLSLSHFVFLSFSLAPLRLDRPSVDSLSAFHTIAQQWLSIERPLKTNSSVVIGVNLRHCLFIVPHGD